MAEETFWQTRETREYPSLRGRVTADVAVIGGGLAGLTVALWLRRAGLRVTLVEARQLGEGSSALCAGVVSLGSGSYARLEKRGGAQALEAYAHTQQSAFSAVDGLTREARCDCAEMDFTLLASERGGERLAAEADAMKRAGVSAELGRADWATGLAAWALRMPHMRVLHPLKYLRFLAAELEGSGGTLYEKSRVIAVEDGAFHTEQGTVQAPYGVIATGYPIINVPGWYFLRMEQTLAGLVPLEGRVTFHGTYASADGRFTLRPLANRALLRLSGVPVGAGERLRLNGESIAARLGMERPTQLFMGMECRTPDGLPYIGPYGRKTPNLFVVAGFGERGILGAMTAAQAISSRILGLPSDGYELYLGQRPLPGPGLPAQLVGRYLDGLFMRPRAPRCPHLGCRLMFNPQTRLWECPCHGSGFDDIGRVCSAPAVHDARLREKR